MAVLKNDRDRHVSRCFIFAGSLGLLVVWSLMLIFTTYVVTRNYMQTKVPPPEPHSRCHTHLVGALGGSIGTVFGVALCSVLQRVVSQSSVDKVSPCAVPVTTAVHLCADQLCAISTTEPPFYDVQLVHDMYVPDT